ncbi:MAG TPA: hypothetical protein H9895_00950 [Candidatus Pseudogracilibacillus intestinigallinarum]|uniref:histidine kinase n=1 Tax=Candidatus Pseudogracilibacillus intestinigallinarum TaxID=2838742 RepID=A0A9D1TIQ6_9BACI|nr:hypothetical protein [Candidatus Pseudogracilibacillus intestinigallinarum]
MFHKLPLNEGNREILRCFSEWYVQVTEEVVLFLLDSELKIIQVSSTIQKYFPQYKHSYINMNFFQLIPHEIFMEDEFQNEHHIFIPKFSHEQRDKKYYFSLLIEEQEVEGETYYFSLLKDITEKVHQEQMNIKQQALIETATLAAGVVHELRNPLTSIKGFLQLLQAGVKQEGVYYEVMIKEVEKLEELTTYLLQTGKPLDEKKQLETVKNLIEDCLFILQTQSELRHVTFEVNMEADYQLFVDARQIKQVFLNVCKNSAEAMEYEGNILIHVFLNEYMNEVVIEIKDEGKGMSEEMIHEWKQPFCTSKQNGTGLGLAISHSIILNHQGKMFFENRKTKGTIATITLPHFSNNNNKLTERR